jgi:uncharacterized protein YndB with AHSA1/START domain
MSDVLTLAFDVDCSVEHAFEVWTSRIGSWWPPDHTMTGPEATVVLESGVGGRIYERGADGLEHDWGEVTVWEPPARLSYLWHIGGGRADATDVDICFVARPEGGTRVEIEHRGWERLGTSGVERRRQNEFGWQTLVPRYREAIVTGDR